MAERMMEKFAELNGMILIGCDPVWGGRFGYLDRDHDDLKRLGFKTKLGAYRNWFKEKFGPEFGLKLFNNMRGK